MHYTRFNSCLQTTSESLYLVSGPFAEFSNHTKLATVAGSTVYSVQQAGDTVFSRRSAFVRS